MDFLNGLSRARINLRGQEWNKFTLKQNKYINNEISHNNKRRKNEYASLLFSLAYSANVYQKVYKNGLFSIHYRLRILLNMCDRVYLKSNTFYFILFLSYVSIVVYLLIFVFVMFPPLLRNEGTQRKKKHKWQKKAKKTRMCKYRLSFYDLCLNVFLVKNEIKQNI